MPLTEYEIIQVIGEIVKDNVKHLATRSDITEVKQELKHHLAQHAKREAGTNKLKMVAAGAIAGGVVSGTLVFLQAWFF